VSARFKAEDGGMKRDLPEQLLQAGDEPPQSLLTSRFFWIGGIVSMGTWIGLSLTVAVLV
jgi:hypothetical protein